MITDTAKAIEATKQLVAAVLPRGQFFRERLPRSDGVGGLSDRERRREPTY
jgi:hypothetical protein